MATIKDVAKLAGVGLGTASRVINNTGYVSEKTKIKVLEAIKKLEYVPNETARAFVTQNNKMVALFLPTVHHAFFSKLAYFIEDELDRNGYKLILCNSGGDKEKEIVYINMLKQNKVSGIIGISYNTIDEYIEKDMPIVLVDRHLGKNIPYVSSDNYGGGQVALDVLKNTGCKHVAYVGSYTKKIKTEVEKRRHGFEEAAKAGNIPYTIFIEEDPILDTKEFLERFLDEYPEVDGVFIENDLLALSLLNIAKNRGIGVPNDLSVIGYDGIDFYPMLETKLSTIRQPVEEMGRSLVQMVLARINGDKVSPKQHPIEFIQGDTTR